MTPVVLEAILKNKSEVGSLDQVTMLREEIETLASTVPSASFSNSGCWRGTQQLTTVEFLLNEIEKLTTESIDYYSNKDPIFASRVQQEFTIHYWTNINKPGSRNVMHAHKPGVLSGVYYIQGTDTGDLRIINPANMLGECNPQSPFTRDFFFTPKDRDLIMWPSWLPHEVEPNPSNRDRINIAFDVRFKNES